MGVPLAPTWTVINELGGPHFKKITVVSSNWMVRDVHHLRSAVDGYV